MKRRLWVAAVVVVAIAAWMVATCLVFRPEYALKRYLEAGAPTVGPMVGWRENDCSCLPPQIPYAQRIVLGPARVYGLWATVPIRVTPTAKAHLGAQEITGEFRMVNEFGWRVAYLRSHVGRPHQFTLEAGFFDPKTTPIVIVK